MYKVHEQLKRSTPMERLLYWITKRESIRLKKEAGEPRPWTDDPILDVYRFCSVRRMDDAVSIWLANNWYVPYKDHQNMLYAVGLARLFNLPSTLDLLTNRVFTGKGKPDWIKVEQQIKERRGNGYTIFNGAYVVSTSGRSMDKVDAVLGYAKGLEQVKVDTASMRGTHEQVMRCYGFSSFMAGQVVADLRWAMSGKWSDRMGWAPVGPGSARGVARLLYALGDWENVARGYASQSVAKSGEWLCDFREHVMGTALKRLPASIATRLEAMDLQNVCCEFDKFERALWGEGVPKQKYKEGR